MYNNISKPINHRLLTHLKGEKFTLIDPAKRNKPCAICSTDKSVKYEVKKCFMKYHICNKCAAFL